MFSPIRNRTAASFLVNLITQENLQNSFEASKTKQMKNQHKEDKLVRSWSTPTRCHSSFRI